MGPRQLQREPCSEHLWSTGVGEQQGRMFTCGKRSQLEALQDRRPWIDQSPRLLADQLARPVAPVCLERQLGAKRPIAGIADLDGENRVAVLEDDFRVRELE